MRRHALIVALSIISLTTATAFGQTLGAVLTAAGEVTPTTSPGFGNATVTFDSTRQNITVTVTVANLGSPIIAAHLHRGPAGTNGGVVIGFTPLASFNNGTLTGTFPIDPALVSAVEILQNPGNFYVNVHTQQFPLGAIRGQLSAAGGTVFRFAADLRGSNETPPNSSMATGSAIVTIDTINNAVTFDVKENGITSPTLAHIHTGAAGVGGGVLITFAGNAAAFNNGRVSGLVSGVDPAQINNIISNPSGFYVNVHSTAFGGGEIRGQLVAANEYDLPVAGHAQGIGTVFVTDARIFNPSYDTAASVLVEFFPAGGGANTIAANSITVNIPPRGNAVLNDVTGPSGLNTAAPTGAIRVTSAESLVATARIYSDRRSLVPSGGTLGQFAPAQKFENALRR
jgi:trimeric autotransporter adhesin